MSDLGLMELTRKRVGKSLTQMMSEGCDYCGDRGWTFSRTEIARQLLTKVRDVLSGGRKMSRVTIDAHPKIVEALYEGYQEDLDAIERKYGADIVIRKSELLFLEQFEVKGK
jgi:ribonuclease G